MRSLITPNEKSFCSKRYKAHSNYLKLFLRGDKVDSNVLKSRREALRATNKRRRGWTGPSLDGLGERTLLVAMIIQAVADIRSGHRRAADAVRWINDRSNDTYFSFEGACELLGLDAVRLRRWAVSKIQRRL